MRNVSDKSCRENKKEHVLCSIACFEMHAVSEVKWENIVEPGGPQRTICRKSIACWIPKATNTHLEYVNTYCFSTATMVARKRLNVTLKVHCVFFPCISSPHATIHLFIFVNTGMWAVSMSVSTDGRAHWGNFSSHTRGTGCRLTCGLRGNDGFNTKRFLSLILMVLLLHEQEDSYWNKGRWRYRKMEIIT